MAQIGKYPTAYVKLQSINKNQVIKSHCDQAISWGHPSHTTKFMDPRGLTFHTYGQKMVQKSSM